MNASAESSDEITRLARSLPLLSLIRPNSSLQLLKTATVTIGVRQHVCAALPLQLGLLHGRHAPLHLGFTVGADAVANGSDAY